MVLSVTIDYLVKKCIVVISLIPKEVNKMAKLILEDVSVLQLGDLVYIKPNGEQSFLTAQVSGFDADKKPLIRVTTWGDYHNQVFRAEDEVVYVDRLPDR